MQGNFTVIAFDPGGCTGYAIGTIDTGGGLSFNGSGEQRFTEYSALWGMLESLSPLYVVAESFEFRKNKQREGIVLESRNILGVLQLWCEIRDRHFCLQSPSVGKGFATNDRLREAGIYQSGKGHSNDAARHLLHWYIFGEGSQYRLKGKCEATPTDSSL